MTIKRRVRLLECWQRTLPVYEEPPRYTREELRQMDLQELSRLYWETFRPVYQGPQVDDAGSKRRREARTR